MTEALSSSYFSSRLCQINKEVYYLVEGAFAHYFSADKSLYHPEDIQWLLEFANEHENWNKNPCEAKTGEGISCDSAKATMQHHYQEGFGTVSPC